MGNYMPKPNKHKKTQAGENDKAVFGSSEMQGWRLSMEDSKIINLCFDDSAMLFGVFDGHGGCEVAQFVARHFSFHLMNNDYYKNKEIEQALISTFLRMDDLMKSEDSIKELMRISRGLPPNYPIKKPVLNQTVGCTALISLIRDSELYVANAGDCRCVLSRGGQALDLSQDHKPTLKNEKARIVNAGGNVVEGRINRGLNLSRAIGDFSYKSNAKLSPNQQMVIAEPEICKILLQQNDQFLIMACDGVWERLKSQDCVDFVNKKIDQLPLSKIAEEILEYCLAPSAINGVGCDNMTIIIVRFKFTNLH